MAGIRRIFRRSTRLAAAALIAGGITTGLALAAAPSAMAASGSCVLDPGTDLSVYAGDGTLMAFGMLAGSSNCVVSPGDTVTINLPPGVQTIGGAFTSSFDDGLWTCTFSPQNNVQTATCTPDVTINMAPGQGSGIFLPVYVPPSTTPGGYQVTASSSFTQTATRTLNVTTCPAGVPLIDPTVAAGAAGVAAAAGLGLTVLRRRRGKAVATP